MTSLVCLSHRQVSDDEKMFNMIDGFQGVGSSCVAGGPRRRTCELAAQLSSDESKVEWREQARMQAILGSCPRSIEKVKSGLRCWIDYHAKLGNKSGPSFPPMIEDLMAYSNVFDCAKTFSNYVTHISIGCQLLGRPVDVFDHPSLSRAVTAIVKRGAHEGREPMFIRFDAVRTMFTVCADKIELAVAVRLYLAAYIFMLRVPSEGVGVTVCHHGVPSDAETPCVVPPPDALEWFFPRRKNTQKLTRMYRECWCKACAVTCPVHVLGAWFLEQPDGSQPFIHIRRASQFLICHLDMIIAFRVCEDQAVSLLRSCKPHSPASRN